MMDYETMNIFAISGHKVRLKTYSAGYDSEKEFVKQHMQIDNVYVVDKTIVHNSSTDVFFKEFPGKRFNSVFFADVEPQSKEATETHEDYIRYNRMYTRSKE